MNDNGAVKFPETVSGEAAQAKIGRAGWCARMGRGALGTAVALATAMTMGAVAEIVISPGASAPEAATVVPEPGSGESQAAMDRMEFLNGDRLQGTFFSMDTASGVKWRHPSIDQLIQVDPAGLGRITLARGGRTNGAPEEACLVSLTNGDELLGALAGLDGEAMVLRTWYAGELRIPRVYLKEIAPGQAPRLAVYEGPDALESWTSGSGGSGRRGGTGEWRFKNGYFYGLGNASIGKDVKLPDRSRIEFEVAWNGYLQMAFSFYTEALEKYGGNAYVLQMSSGSVYLQRNNKDGNSVNLGHAESQLLAQRSRAEVALLSHREQKTITLLVNGAMVKQWTERGDFSPGTGIAFFQQGQGVVRVGSLRVTEWDGKFDAPESGSSPGDKDLVQLSNQDKISGRLQAIRDGVMELGTEFATLQVPLERVASITLADAGRQELGRRPTDVRAVLGRRGSMTLTVSQWDERQVIGESAGLGAVKALPWAFSRIEFNLERLEGEDAELEELEEARAQFQELFKQ